MAIQPSLAKCLHNAEWGYLDATIPPFKGKGFLVFKPRLAGFNVRRLSLLLVQVESRAGGGSDELTSEKQFQK